MKKQMSLNRNVSRNGPRRKLNGKIYNKPNKNEHSKRAQKKRRSRSATKLETKSGYVVCPMDKRLSVLHTFIRKYGNKKVIIILNSFWTVDFFKELMAYLDTPVITTHEKESKNMRQNAIKKLVSSDSGIMFCSETVSKQLGFPPVDWIIQFDPPMDIEYFTERLRNQCLPSAREQQKLLFITEGESGFIDYLKEQKFRMNRIEIAWSKVSDFQEKLEELVKKRYAIYINAKQAFSGFLKTYKTHPRKEMFDISKLNLQQAGRMFGFAVPPFVDLDSCVAEDQPKRKRENDSNKKRKRMKKQIKD